MDLEYKIPDDIEEYKILFKTYPENKDRFTLFTCTKGKYKAERVGELCLEMYPQIEETECIPHPEQIYDRRLIDYFTCTYNLFSVIIGSALTRTSLSSYILDQAYDYAKNLNTVRKTDLVKIGLHIAQLNNIIKA